MGLTTYQLVQDSSINSSMYIIHYMISTVSHCAEIQRLVLDTTPTTETANCENKKKVTNHSTSTSETPLYRSTSTPPKINIYCPSKKWVVSKLGIYKIPRGFGQPIRFRGWVTEFPRNLPLNGPRKNRVSNSNLGN